MTDLYSCIVQQEMPRTHPQGSVCLSKPKPILQKAQNCYFFKSHFTAPGVSQDVMDTYRLQPCALSASTSRYLHTCGRQAEPMFASLVSTVKHLDLNGTVRKMILQMDARDAVVTVLLLGEQGFFLTGS